jgi:uncharacterized protein (TIGR02147 family)
MPNIYTFIDYRKYLLEVIAEKKLSNHRFSCRMLSMQLGISAATFVRIVNGKRNLSKKMLPKFIAYLKLRDRASEYFHLLVDLSQVKDPERKNAIYQKILDFRSERVKTIQPSHYALFDNWFLPVLREIIDIRGTVADHHCLADMVRPPLPVREIRKAVRTLTDSGLLTTDKNGRYCSSDKLLSTGDTWEHIAISRFQGEMIRLAGEALLTIPKKERDVSTLTVGVSGDDIIRIKEILRRTRQEILSLIEGSSDREYVYQLNTQFFPLSTNLTESDSHDAEK